MLGLRIPGIPTWQQFRGWSLPSKATYVALWITIVCAPFALIPGGRDFATLVYDMLFGVPYEASLVEASKKMIRLAVQNNTSEAVTTVGARFDIDLHEQGKPVRRIVLPVNVISLDGAKSPFVLNAKSRISVDIDERSLRAESDARQSACQEYRRRQLLRSLGQNQNRGGLFLCAMSIVLRDADHEKTAELSANAAFCEVLETIVGSWKDQEHSGGPGSAEELQPPSRTCR
jgi:hypothetical protein